MFSTPGSRGHQPGVVGDELEHVEVAGHDRRLEAAPFGVDRDRADDVVRLVARQLVDGDAQRLDHLADLRELVAQVVRHALAGRLVLGVLLVAEGRTLEVEGDRDVVRADVRDAAQDDAAEAEDGVDELALRGRQGRQREISAIDEPVAVEQHQAFRGHGPSVAADRCRAARLDPAAARPARDQRRGAAGSPAQQEQAETGEQQDAGQDERRRSAGVRPRREVVVFADGLDVARDAAGRLRGAARGRALGERGLRRGRQPAEIPVRGGRGGSRRDGRGGSRRSRGGERRPARGVGDGGCAGCERRGNARRPALGRAHDGRRHGRDASRRILRGRWPPGCRAAHRQHRWHGGDQQAGQAERREADRERPAEAVTRRPEGTDEAAPPARPQPCGIGRRQDVVARPGGGRHRPGRRPERDEIGVQLGAQAAAGDQGLGRRSLGGGRRPVGERGDEDRVVRGMGSGRAWIGHLARQTGCRRDRFPGGPGEASRVGRASAGSRGSRGAVGSARCGASERAEIVVQRGARWAGRDDGLGARALRRIELAVEQRRDPRGVVILVPTAGVSHGTAPSGPRAGPGGPAGRDGCATSRSRATRRSSRRSRRSRSPRCRTGRSPSAGRR